MAKKNKLWFSGEGAQLAARFTKFMTKVLYARRASYIRVLMVKAKFYYPIREVMRFPLRNAATRWTQCTGG